MSAYGFLMPVSFLIALSILAWVCFGIDLHQQLEIIRAIRDAGNR